MPPIHSGLQKEVFALYRRCVLSGLGLPQWLMIMQSTKDGPNETTINERQIPPLHPLQFQDASSGRVASECEHGRAPPTTREKAGRNVRKPFSERLLGITGDA